MSQLTNSYQLSNEVFRFYIEAGMKQTKKIGQLPNQELTLAKSALQDETVGVCSSYKRGGHPPNNFPAAHLRFTGIFPPSRYKQQYHLRPTVGLQGYFSPLNYKHSCELRPTCGKIPVIVTYLEINYIIK